MLTADLPTLLLLVPLALAGVIVLLAFEQVLFLVVVGLAPYALNPWITYAVGISAAPIMVPLLGVSVLGRRLLRGGALPFPKALVPAVAFVAVGALSVVYAGNAGEAALSVERAALRVVLFPYLAWLLVRSRPAADQARFIHRVVMVLMAVAFIGGVIALAQFAWKRAYWLPEAGVFLAYRRDYLFRPIALTESPTTWGIFLILPSAVALSRLIERFTLWHALAAAFFLMSLAASGTRSAWAGMFVALAWLVAGPWRRARLLVRVAVALSVIVLGILVVVGPLRDAVVQRVTARGESVEARREILTAGLRIVTRHPLTGVGAGNFASYISAHPEIVTVGDVPYVISEEGFQSHNTLLGVWAETGIVGLAAFVWLLLTVWRAFSRSSRRLRTGPAAISPLLVDGLQAAYLGFLVASMGQRIDEYLFVWLMPGLAFMLFEHTRTAGAPGPETSPSSAQR